MQSGRSRLFCFFIAADMCQTAAGQGVAPMRLRTPFRPTPSHAAESIRKQVEDGIERPIGVRRHLLVVGTAALAAVAAEKSSRRGRDSSGTAPVRWCWHEMQRPFLSPSGRRWRPWDSSQCSCGSGRAANCWNGAAFASAATSRSSWPSSSLVPWRGVTTSGSACPTVL